MGAGLTINKSIDINALPSWVWQVLVNPQLIAQYFTGAETISNWQPGDEIVFVHQYNGQEYRNKGIILTYDHDHILSYTYWTAFSETEDLPENYTTIIYSLIQIGNITRLVLTQMNFKNGPWYLGMEKGWDMVLVKMKEIAESL